MDFAPNSIGNNSDNDSANDSYNHSANDRPTLAYHRPARRKTRITIYLDDEVLDHFRALAKRYGTGYQTLINAALCSRLSGASCEPGWFV
ncbi:BrnA antitoxin family protein [Massilia sp. 2TAF26]|uniref:BrnA antitoxin family protein n=1 Tax=Massilia sp. 2TAF26 TaxID=3233012 RepID=UPI003F985FF1